MNEFLGGEESKFKARDDIPKNGNYGGEWLVLFSDGSVRSYDMGRNKNIFFYATPSKDVRGYLKKQPNTSLSGSEANQPQSTVIRQLTE